MMTSHENQEFGRRADGHDCDVTWSLVEFRFYFDFDRLYAKQELLIMRKTENTSRLFIYSLIENKLRQKLL